MDPPFVFVRELVLLSFTSEQDSKLFCKGIIDVFLQHRKLTELMTCMINYELSLFEGKTNFELFRKDSIVGRLFSSLITRVGSQYCNTVVLEEVVQFLRYHEKGINIDVKQKSKKISSK